MLKLTDALPCVQVRPESTNIENSLSPVRNADLPPWLHANADSIRSSQVTLAASSRGRSSGGGLPTQSRVSIYIEAGSRGSSSCVELSTVDHAQTHGSGIHSTVSGLELLDMHSLKSSDSSSL